MGDDWRKPEIVQVGTDAEISIQDLIFDPTPLDCQGIETSGKGKFDIRECEIEGPLQVEVVGARG